MTQNVKRGIISVRADAGAPGFAETKEAITALQKAFSDFKSAHEEEIKSLRAGLSGTDDQAKLEKINAELDKHQQAVDDINKRMAAAQMMGVGSPVKDKEYSTAFAAHLRTGDVQAALNKGTAEEGGFLTPIEWDRTITSKLSEVSPMRQYATVISTSKAGFSKLFNVGGTASGWVGETDERPETPGPKFKSLEFGSGEIYANVAATQQILDDAEINLETYIADEVQSEFSLQEGAAFISGDGNKKPFGILTYVTGGANAAKHPFGAIKVKTSGAANDITGDSVLDLIYDLPSPYTGGAYFGLNRKTVGKVRKLKDGQGNYLWQPSYIADQPSTLAGFPTAEFPDMPDVAADAVPILFGDFKRSYLVIDRIGIRMLRDPYTNKPYVMFYITKRVGGGLLNPQPMRALKIAE